MVRTSYVVLFAALPLLAGAQDPSIRRIEAAVEKARRQYDVPGASLVVVKDGKVVLLKGFGLRDVAKKLPATPDTVFAIGSSTKAFTALAVNLAAQEGKLSLADRPSKYLPNFRLKDPEANEKITISDLMCHRSGLPRVDLVWYTGRYTTDEVFDVVSMAEPTAKFGTKWQYQNAMFMTAGQIAGKVYGSDYHRVLQDRIFTPLGMASTSSTEAGYRASPDRATGYLPAGKLTPQRPLNFRNIDVAAPAGSINSSARDMAQWLKLQLGRGTVDGKAIVPKEAVEETWKPRMDMVPGGDMKYGYGWMLRKWNDLQLVEHGGNIDGFNAQVALLPEKNIGLVMLTNVSGGPLAGAAIDLVFKELVEVPKKPAAAAGTTFAEVAEADLGTYEMAGTPLKLTFRKVSGKLEMEQGPVKIPLNLTADRTYEGTYPGVPAFKFEFKPSEKDPKTTVLALDQGGMKLTLEKAKPYQADISGADLLAKSVEATGGPAAIRKMRHMVADFTARMPSDVVEIAGRIYSKDGNKGAQFAVMYCLGRRFGAAHTHTDGVSAAEEVSFVQYGEVYGTQLLDAINSADIEMDLNPAKAYKSLKVVREEKVGTEDCYVLEKVAARGGSPITDWISKKTFLPMKRQIGQSTSTFEKYGEFEGLKQPVKITSVGPGGGASHLEITNVRFDGEIPAWAFRSVPQR